MRGVADTSFSMARTPLFDTLRRALWLARASEAQRLPPRELLERAHGARLDRRELLRAAAGTAALSALPFGTTACGSDETTGPRVVVVGAGLAGLHAAHRLNQAGVRATVYEGADRVGGRTYTARGMFGSQLAELGGELIDSNHVTMRALAMELGEPLDDLEAGAPAGYKKDVYHFGGREIGELEIVEAFRPVAAMMSSLLTSAEEDDALFESTDAMSLAAWLDAVPMIDPVLKQILAIAYTGEYGLEPEEQSIFNLLYLIDHATPEPFRIFGDSDERYHLHNGNDSLATKLASGLSGQLETGAKLASVVKTAAGAYTLSFERGTSTFDVEADHVILAIPFTTLRSVSLASAGLAEDKVQVIDELGYGTNAKQMGHFTSRVWREVHNASGSATTDNGIQMTWDTARGQEGPNGLLTNFVGGALGVASGMGTAEARYAEALPKIDQVFPGAMAAYIANSAVRMHWPTVPLNLGSYACYKPGQWAFYGVEGRREGNLHFAGEHCSLDFQGFMEGAAETGAAAAAEVLADLGLAASTATLRARPSRRHPRRPLHLAERLRRAARR